VVAPAKGVALVAEVVDALRQAREFMSSVNDPAESEDEQLRLTSTLHALDHASRLAETAGEMAEFEMVSSGSEDARAALLCGEAMRSAASAAAEVAVLPGSPDHTVETKSQSPMDSSLSAAATSAEEPLVRLEHCARALEELRRAHRVATLGAVASGALTAGEAIVRVDTVRRLEALAHHAWRSAAHLLGRGEYSAAHPNNHTVTGRGRFTRRCRLAGESRKVSGLRNRRQRQRDA
jgi:phosphate:Na+ symporter